MFSDFIADVGKNAEVGLPAVFPVSVGVARGQTDVVVEGANHQTRASVGHETIGTAIFKSSRQRRSIVAGERNEVDCAAKVTWSQIGASSLHDKLQCNVSLVVRWLENRSCRRPDSRGHHPAAA